MTRCRMCGGARAAWADAGHTLTRVTGGCFRCALASSQAYVCGALAEARTRGIEDVVRRHHLETTRRLTAYLRERMSLRGMAVGDWAVAVAGRVVRIDDDVACDSIVVGWHDPMDGTLGVTPIGWIVPLHLLPPVTP